MTYYLHPVGSIIDPTTGKPQLWRNADGSLSPLVNQEIGDITAYATPYAASMAVLDGYVVQKYWSVAANASVAPGGTDYQPLAQVPGGMTGTHFVAQSLNVVSGVRQTVELQITGTNAPNPDGKAWFVGTWKDASTGGVVRVGGLPELPLRFRGNSGLPHDPGHRVQRWQSDAHSERRGNRTGSRSLSPAAPEPTPSTSQANIETMFDAMHGRANAAEVAQNRKSK